MTNTSFILTPEEQLVLAALTLHPTTDEWLEIETLAGEVRDWDYVARTAIKCGMGPLLHSKLPHLKNGELIPPEVQKKLHNAYLRTLARGMRIYNGFKEVGHALNKHQIPFVVLKGVQLAETLYKDIGLRQLSDIDLLVAVEDGERSLEILNALGYQSYAKQTVQSRFIEKNLEIVHYTPVCKEDILVEIHIKLHRKSPLYRFNIPSMIQQAVPTMIQGVPCSVLNTYDLLIHLCMHADKHFRSGFVQFTCYSDIVNLWKQLSIATQWQPFIDRCEFHQCKEAVIDQLYLLHHFCGLSLPSPLNDTKQAIPKKDLLRFVAILRGKRHTANTFLLALNARQGFEHTGLWLRYLLDMLHPEKDFMIARYKIKNPAMYRVYYLKRYWDGFLSLINKLN